MTDVIPIFSSSNSLSQGGIFTLEKAGEKEKQHRKTGPLSLCDLAKRERLKRLYLAESKMAAFMQAHKNLSSIGCSLHFGLKVVVCEDMNDKSDPSRKTESKVIIWPARDTDSVYERFIKISSKAAQDGFYYYPRIDWKTLCGMWSNDFLLSLPFYSSFLAKNTLTFSSIVPQLPAAPLVLREIGADLPVDGLLNEVVDRYAKASGAEIQAVKSVYYETREDAKAFQVWRCILEGTTFDKPNLDGMHSRNFSWESYKEVSK